MVIERLPNPENCWGLKWEFVAKKTDIHWEKLYKWFREYLRYEGWKDVQIGEDFYESLLQDITLPNGAKNQWVWFRAFKEPKINSSKYIKLYLKLDIQTLFLVDKEVMHNGKKLKLQNGEFNFKGWVYFAEDQDKGTREESEWNTNSFLNFWKRRFWWIANRDVIGQAKQEVLHYSNEIYYYLHEYTGVKPPGDIKDYHAAIRGLNH